MEDWIAKQRNNCASKRVQLMRYNATVLRSGIRMINIDSGESEPLLIKTYYLETVTHKDREYQIIGGTRVGAITNHWVNLESAGSVKLERLDGPMLDNVRLPITTRAQLTSHQIQNLRIGVLCKGRFLCNKCSLKEDLCNPEGIAVYPINILPYSQSCWGCGLVIVQIMKKRDGGLMEVFSKPIPIIKTKRLWD